MASVKVSISELAEEYLFDCQARKLSPRTIGGYKKLLNLFQQYLRETEFITTMDELTPQAEHFLSQGQKL